MICFLIDHVTWNFFYSCFTLLCSYPGGRHMYSDFSVARSSFNFQHFTFQKKNAYKVSGLGRSIINDVSDDDLEMVGLCDLLFFVFGFINLVGLTEYCVTCGYHACMYMIRLDIMCSNFSVARVSTFNI